MSSGSSTTGISRHEAGQRHARQDQVAIEEPLEIRLGYSTPDGRASRSLSITMRTPGHDDELAAGFLFSESIVASAGDIVSIEPCGEIAGDSGQRNIIRVELGRDVAVDLARLQRHFYTSSSCGVCGKASLDALRAVGLTPIGDDGTSFTEAVLLAMPERLRAAQPTFDATGGLHAAGVFSHAGDLRVTREDIGRHNAVDKVIGRLLLDGELPANDCGLMVSGRASFELTQKALVAGLPLLAAVSAPSSLAVALAREFNMTLVGFLRDAAFNVYAGEQRIAP